MNYELAKQLKDARFDVEHNTEIYTYVDKKDNPCQLRLDAARIPTLSELIEACGEGFEYLNRVHGGGWVAGTMDTKRKGTMGDSNYESGETPEEAVARLWLTFNKKPPIA